MISKKIKKIKKRSSPKSRLLFRPISQIQTFEGGLFSNGGGLFSIFHRKSASKAQKACDFAYFTSQWGGARAPPPRPPWLRYWECRLVHHRHSGRISSVILAKRVAAPKKTKTTLRHKHLAVLPTAKRQMSHNVIIENLITNHNHMRKTVVAKIK